MRSSNAPPAERDLGAAIADVTPTMMPSGSTMPSSRPGGYFTGEEAMGFLREKEEQDKRLQEEFIRQAQIAARGASARIKPVTPPKTEPAEQPAQEGLALGKKPQTPEQLKAGLTESAKAIAKIEKELQEFEDQNVKLVEKRNRIKTKDIGGKEYNSLTTQINANERIIKSKRDAIQSIKDRAVKDTSDLELAATKKAAEELKAGSTKAQQAQIDEINSWIQENSKIPEMFAIVALVTKQFSQKRKAGLTVQNIIDSANAEIAAGKQRADAKIAARNAEKAKAEELDTQSKVDRQRGDIQNAINKKQVILAGIRTQLQDQGAKFEENGDIEALPYTDSTEDKNSLSDFISYYRKHQGELAELQRLLGAVGGSSPFNSTGSTAGGNSYYNPARPQTEEEFETLPIGSYYIDPDDNRIYRK